jgi:hypothetical protein
MPCPSIGFSRFRLKEFDESRSINPRPTNDGMKQIAQILASVWKPKREIISDTARNRKMMRLVGV